MVKLPTEKSEPLSDNPKFLILFGKPKSGKTTVLAGLDNCLIVDLEDGSDYVKCMNVKTHSVEELREIAKAIKEAGSPYDYIAFDTGTKLEDMVLPYAGELYKQTPMGKTWGSLPGEDDVRKLPNGAGYLYIREAYKNVLNAFKPLAKKCFILVGHTAEKTINKEGKELSENSLDLSGKLGRIISADADAMGFMYRNKNENRINFNGGEDFIVEARPAHIRGRDIKIAESEGEGKDVKMKYYWNEIFN